MRLAKFSYNTSLRHSGRGSFHCVDEAGFFSVLSLHFVCSLTHPSMSKIYICEENANWVYQTA